MLRELLQYGDIVKIKNRLDEKGVRVDIQTVRKVVNTNLHSLYRIEIEQEVLEFVEERKSERERLEKRKTDLLQAVKGE